jgi:diguanylate cyclase (GGDEF)-like protein
VTGPAAAYSAGLTRARRLWAVALASLALLLLLGTLATAIVVSQRQSRSHILATFGLRGTSSATFVATYLYQQAAREQQTAEQFLSGPRVPADRFKLAVAAFGSGAAVLLDSSGRLLDVAPSAPRLLGRPIAARYAHLTAAEHGRTAVSNVVPSAARRTAVTAIAVPFSTPSGRRVFSAAYRVSGSALGAFVAHTVPYRAHEVFLVDSSGRLVAASPTTTARTLAAADPRLARAAAHAGHGTVAGAKTPTTFTVAPVPGTSWRLLIAVPDSRLYASIAGWTQMIPWLVFVLVSVLGGLLVALFARSLADRSRLAVLSATLEKTAQTDPLTGLSNRRALTEHLIRGAVHARRRGEPLSVLMIDLDRFKETNDRFGHEAGDQVLCAVADCMREVLRADDVYGRWGGDEFLVAMPATDEAGARTVAERLRAITSAVDLSDIGLPEGIPLSIGAATAVLTSPIELVRAADVELYRAKTADRGIAAATSSRETPALDQSAGARRASRSNY